MTRVLITGFEPFRQWTANSSWEAVARLSAERPWLSPVQLPVDHAMAAEAVRSLIRRRRPDVVLLTGLAAGSACRLETLGRPGPMADHPVVRRGRWPFADSMAALAQMSVPVRLSRDAGAFVCDTTYWAALGEPGPRLCLFLHVPPLGQAWTLSRLTRAVGAVLDAGTTTPRRSVTNPAYDAGSWIDCR